MKPLLENKEFSQETDGWRKALEKAGSLYGRKPKDIANELEVELIKVIVDDVCVELKKSSLIGRVKTFFNKITTIFAKGNRDSETSATQDCDYEVFLSFRDEDTHNNFNDNLYKTLLNYGIRTFRDNKGPRMEQKIDPAVRTAICHCKITIPIFCKDYASSKCYLRELAKIVECRKQRDQRQITVIPIFYHLDPLDVRNQNGSYMNASQNYQKRFSQETKGWKKDLKKVGELKEWGLKMISNGNDLTFIYDIVKAVLNELKKSPLTVYENQLVGIDSHVEEMLKLLKIESNDIKTVVGIHGLDGIGKTTIARCVCKTVHHQFDGWSFIADAGETLRMKGHIHLQSQLIGDILKLENSNVTIVNQKYFREILSNKRVLVVFDDVDFDLKKIIGKHDWFGSGSKIIITTKDRHILDDFGVDETYEPKAMDFDQALELFSKHAFKRDQPPEHFLVLSEEVVKFTGILPLALEVIGSSLFCQQKSAWEDMVNKLKNIPNDKLQKKLRIGYDGLSCVEQEIFLDIACFFIGKDRNIVCHRWDGHLFPEIGIEVLRRKSLIKIDENNELRMHVHLRDLGREIVHQENPKAENRSRLWLEEEVLDFLNTQKGPTNVKGLCLEVSNMLFRDHLMIERLAAMTNISLLKLYYPKASPKLKHSFSELRWLSLIGSVIPTNPQKLAVLDLSFSNITRNWPGWSYIKFAKTLKGLDLKYNVELLQTPDLSKNRELEVLLLQGCVNLDTIDASFDHLRKLVILNMEQCSRLKCLPINIFMLRSLEKLNIRFTGITQLPENLDSLEALTELLIDETSIEKLPNSIGNLRNLKTLSARGCKIQEGGIPGDIGKVSSLESLSLNGNQIHSLPATVSGLCLLQTLSLARCTELQSLPELPSSLKSLNASSCAIESLPNLSNLTNLEELCLDNCQNLVNIPTTISALSRLKSLCLTNCCALPCIPQLPLDLRSMTAAGCGNVTEISGFSDMRNLVIICLDKCDRLEKIERLEGLDSLPKLEIRNCGSLRNLPKLQGLKKLMSLKFFEVGISEIESLEGLYSLDKLIIESCISLRKIPNLSDSKNLVFIQVEQCDALSEIEGVEGLNSLEQLDIRHCNSLIKIQLPKKLRILYIDRCEKLSEIEGHENLESLEEITIRHSPSVLPNVSTWKNLKYLELYMCDCMERLPDLSKSNKLKNLRIQKCGKLIEVLSVDRLEFLEEFKVVKCKSMEKLPDLSNFTKLRELHIKHCEKLTKLQGADKLEILEVLLIDGCISIETLPCLSNLKKLRILSAVKCEKLTMIQGVGELESLRQLNISKCISIETIPCLLNLTKLRKVSAVKCKKLTKIQNIERLKSLRILNVRGSRLLKFSDLSRLRKSLFTYIGPNSDDSSHDVLSDLESGDDSP
ncbi:hypothetical protein NE237_000078 [Protea cynaroides]|uniref:TIR domain-containing protein n=1 Tax=Protea cynaroides TaxID=273540 RepID=A0A9Q0JR66_9MAGN|nr:hypothetical protein NE237_000078 [Protea cynaroides]